VQVPEGLRDFRRQQRRWSNGFVQVAQRTIVPIWRAPWTLTQRIAAIALVAISVMVGIVFLVSERKNKKSAAA